MSGHASPAPPHLPPMAHAPPRRRARLALALALASAFALLSSACGSYHAIVRTEGAPLYADPGGARELARLDKLDRVDIGWRLPSDDPLPVTAGRVEGFVRQEDLWVFERPNGADLDRLTDVHRREVVLSEKPWSPATKDDIRNGRVRPGMSREMVTLAWGLPRSVDRAEDGVETWTFETVVWDVRDTHYRVVTPDVHIGLGFGWGYGWYGRGWGAAGFGLGFPLYTDSYYRTYRPRTVIRQVRFEQGVVAHWKG